MQTALDIFAILIAVVAIVASVTFWRLSRASALKARISAREAERYAEKVEKDLGRIIATRQEIQRLRGENPN
jgi:Flp pilus assembly protein TadB